MKITLTNVRGFAGTHTISIRPITILIGENSSGKTTLLAAIYAALNRDFPATDGLFNRAPFELGSYDTIATYRGGKFGRAANFSLGWSAEVEQISTSVIATFKSRSGTPVLESLSVKYGESDLIAQIDGTDFAFEFRSNGPNLGSARSTASKVLRVVKFKTPLERIKSFRLQDTVRYFIESLEPGAIHDGRDSLGAERIFQALHELSFSSLGSRPYAKALAPMRTRPRRTYDDLAEDFKPEGEHVPRVLARLLASTDREKSKELNALLRYGVASGLFNKIDVKQLGRQPSDPFQVRVKTKGPDANLIDVGYGVSQSLPIVIDSIMAKKDELLLVQQPEVHLHPKAQAALGTFFVDLAVNSSKTFVIETHSDYLVDRVRMAVADGTIPASDVQLLYLDRKGLDVTAHELTLDTLGNITNAPPSYRNFFLEEEIALMSRASPGKVRKNG